MGPAEHNLHVGRVALRDLEALLRQLRIAADPTNRADRSQRQDDLQTKHPGGAFRPIQSESFFLRFVLKAAAAVLSA